MGEDAVVRPIPGGSEVGRGRKRGPAIDSQAVQGGGSCGQGLDASPGQAHRGGGVADGVESPIQSEGPHIAKVTVRRQLQLAATAHRHIVEYGRAREGLRPTAIEGDGTVVVGEGAAAVGEAAANAHQPRGSGEAAASEVKSAAKVQRATAPAECSARLLPVTVHRQVIALLGDSAIIVGVNEHVGDGKRGIHDSVGVAGVIENNSVSGRGRGIQRPVGGCRPMVVGAPGIPNDRSPFDSADVTGTAYGSWDAALVVGVIRAAAIGPIRDGVQCGTAGQQVMSLGRAAVVGQSAEFRVGGGLVAGSIAGAAGAIPHQVVALGGGGTGRNSGAIIGGAIPALVIVAGDDGVFKLHRAVVPVDAPTTASTVRVNH